MLDLVLGLGGLGGHPLHIPWSVDAAALKRKFMVDHEASARAQGLAGARTGIYLLERTPRRSGSLDAIASILVDQASLKVKV
jgi:hypothetical protein